MAKQKKCKAKKAQVIFSYIKKLFLKKKKTKTAAKQQSKVKQKLYTPYIILFSEVSFIFQMVVSLLLPLYKSFSLLYNSSS